MKSLTALSLSIYLVFMAIATTAQPPVLDTSGNPLQTGVEYYILPGVTDVAGGLTLIDRNNSCPLFVGQETLGRIVSPGLSVVFKPFAVGETIIRESRDLTVTFQAASTCAENTAWVVGGNNTETGRRYIVTAGQADYFVIRNNGGVYNFAWCPIESCPNCSPRCGSAGIVIENNQMLLVLDGPAFPFQFRRV